MPHRSFQRVPHRNVEVVDSRIAAHHTPTGVGHHDTSRRSNPSAAAVCRAVTIRQKRCNMQYLLDRLARGWDMTAAVIIGGVLIYAAGSVLAIKSIGWAFPPEGDEP